MASYLTGYVLNVNGGFYIACGSSAEAAVPEPLHRIDTSNENRLPSRLSGSYLGCWCDERASRSGLETAPTKDPIGEVHAVARSRGVLWRLTLGSRRRGISRTTLRLSVSRSQRSRARRAVCRHTVRPERAQRGRRGHLARLGSSKIFATA
jgi:hypothetical protein